MPYTSPPALGIRTAIAPGDVAVSMPGTPSIAQIMNRAADLAIDFQFPLDLRYPLGDGRWVIDAPLIWSKPDPLHPDAAWLRPPEVIGGNVNIEVAETVTAPLDYMVKMRNTANARLHGLRLNAKSQANGCLDTSYALSGAPSLGNAYVQIVLDNALVPTGVPAWNASGNNDCDFNDVFIGVQSSQAAHKVALLLDTPGGQSMLSKVRCFGGYVDYQAQALDVNRCVFTGMRVIKDSDDHNTIFFSGENYIYAGENKTNLCVPLGSHVRSLRGTSHFENGYDNGRIIGGSGQLFSGFQLGGQLFATGNATGVALLADSVTHPQGGAKMLCSFEGSSDGVALNDTAHARVTLVSYLDGSLRSRRYNGNVNSVTEDPEAMAYAMADWTWGAMAANKSRPSANVPPNVGVIVSAAGFPRLGTLYVEPTNGDCPSAIFTYNLATGQVEQRAAYNKTGTVEVGFVPGSGPTAGGYDFSVAHHEAGKNTVYRFAAFGVGAYQA